MHARWALYSLRQGFRDISIRRTATQCGAGDRGVYNSGILAAPKDGSKIFNYAHAKPEIVMKVEALRAVCEDYEVPLTAAAIRFPMRHPAVTCVVVGAKTSAQLRQNAEWFDAELPETIWTDIDKALEEGAD